MVRIARAGVVFLAVLGGLSQAWGQNSITINSNIRYQTITGWEATAQSGQEDAVGFNYYKGKLFDQAIKDLGITRLRVEIKSGSENPVDYWSQYRAGQIDLTTLKAHRYVPVNDNSSATTIAGGGFQFAQLDYTLDNVVVPMREKMAARGQDLYINLNYVSFNSLSDAEYAHASPQEYAEFVEATYLHMQQKYGFVPDAWEVILEPNNSSFWWSGQRVGQAILAAAQRLASHGFTPRFIAPSVSSLSQSVTYLDQLVQVPGVTQYIEEFSYHRYGGATDATLQAIGQRGAAAGVNTSMLEHIASGYQDLHKDLKLVNVSAWQQYCLAYPTTDDGAQYYYITNGSTTNPQVNMGSRTKFLRQYFRYIRPGAVRVQAATTNAAFDPVTFINTGGGYVTVINATAGGTFGIQGLPAGMYGISYTTGSQYDIARPNVTLTAGQVLSTSIPAAGVLTVYAWPGPRMPGDANDDGVVDVGDLGVLGYNYGKLTGATWAMGDFNGDGAVDVGDLGILGAHYGQTRSGQ